MSNATSCCCFVLRDRGRGQLSVVTFGGKWPTVRTRPGEFVALPPFQAEQAFERLHEPVVPPSARGFLEGNSRLVQELVEQRMAEMIELGSVVRVQVGQSS